MKVGAGTPVGAISLTPALSADGDSGLEVAWLAETDQFGRVVSSCPAGENVLPGSLRLLQGESLCEQISTLSASVGAGLERARIEQRERHFAGLGSWSNKALWLSVDYVPGQRPGAGQAKLATSEFSVRSGDTVPSDLAAYVSRQGGLSLTLMEFFSAVATDAAFEASLPVRLQSLAAALSSDAAALLVVEPGLQTVRLVAESTRARKRRRDSLTHNLADPIVTDLLRRPRLVEFDSSLPVSASLTAVLAPGYRRVIMAPCLSMGEVHGLLVLSGRQALGSDELEIEALGLVATTLGQWLASRSLSGRKAELEGVVATQQATAQAISRSLDVDHTYRAVARNVSAVVKDTECMLFAREGDSYRLSAVASSAHDVWDLANCTVFLDAGAATAEALLHEQPFSIGGVEGRHGVSLSENVVARTNGRPIIFLPMVMREELLGALALYPSRRDRAPYSASELHRAEAFAEQAAIAISNAQLHRTLAQSTDRVKSLLVGIGGVRERERRSFASIVHDDIVQSVVAAVYELEALRDDAPDVLSEDIDRTVDLLRRSIGDARRVISEMRAPVLDSMSLAESLQLLAERLDREVPCRVKAKVQHIPGLSVQASAACYRMAREALTNAIRHASADLIEISLAAEWTLEGRVLHLTIEDDGVGIDSTRLPAADHYGLAMMEEQAAMLGGEMTAGQRPSGGTLVSISLPLAQGRNREKPVPADG
jgi:signal transduction histidine kinase